MSDSNFGVGVEIGNSAEKPFTKLVSKSDVNTFYESGVEDIKRAISGYEESLLNRGVKKGEWLDRFLAHHESLMKQQLTNNLNFASGNGKQELIYNEPADFEAFYDAAYRDYLDHTKNSFGDSIENFGDEKNDGAQESNGAKNTFVPLLQTAQEKERLFLGGKYVTVFDHPFDVETKNNICRQGSAFPNGLKGTCGNCAVGSIMNKAGFNFTEHSVVSYALSKNLCDKKGGTSPYNWVRLLDDLAGIKSKAYINESLESLALKVEEGRGVIIGVSSKTYKPEWYGKPDCNNVGGHALVLESVIRDERTGEILEFVVTDSNGKSKQDACQQVSKKTLEEAYDILNRRAVVTDEIIW